MDNISKKSRRVFGLMLISSGLIALCILATSCGSPHTQAVADREINFADRQNFTLTGGDSEEAGLAGFQRDSFDAFFSDAVREILSQRGLTEVGASQIDSADYIIRYILRAKLIITALDPVSRRLIWRGQSDESFVAGSLSQSLVTKLVEQAISGFPPRR